MAPTGKEPETEKLTYAASAIDNPRHAGFGDLAVASLCAAIGLSGVSITFLIASLWPDCAALIIASMAT
ncbi:MAG TPA: hypothetical protein VMB83_07370 [Roseiarcus sp.]|nr:hypothetical protein [Roseiarcus sp.]